MNDYFARIMARLTPEQLAQANAVKDALLAAIEAENAAMKTDLKGEPPHDENFLSSWGALGGLSAMSLKLLIVQAYRDGFRPAY